MLVDAYPGVGMNIHFQLIKILEHSWESFPGILRCGEKDGRTKYPFIQQVECNTGKSQPAKKSFYCVNTPLTPIIILSTAFDYVQNWYWLVGDSSNNIPNSLEEAPQADETGFEEQGFEEPAKKTVEEEDSLRKLWINLGISGV